MPPVLTITLNPAVDLAAETEHVSAGPKLRLSEPVIEPGGGGINVARVVACLGGRVRLIAALGGLTGARLQALIADAGLDLERFDVPGETRQSLSVTDRATGQQYRFVMPGPRWSDAMADQFMDAIDAASPAQGWAVLSGSQPPGLDEAFPRQLASRMQRRDVRLIVDTSGPALDSLIKNGKAATLWGLRMNQGEAAAAAGHPLPDLADSLAFARTLYERGVAQVVVLGRGAEGSVLVADRLRLSCRPPAVAVKSPVGAGDSFTGAFVLEMAQTGDLAQALTRGTAAAAAAVTTAATELCRAEDVARLISGCMLTRH
ncbi:MAG: 6-phosphofructokinase 2 PfkB [Rhodobacteraceae bacterium HLUCCA12]|nr:MAG: 6-phosphofructokinase 2 PfkB [Rhodobacteraceae bacterium HLUCCA12]